MKKIFIIICLAVLASFRLSAKASGFTSGNLVYNIVSEDELTCEVGGMVGRHTMCDIPQIVESGGNRFQVVGIGRNAFRCARLQDVTLPAGLEYIGDYAFLGCRLKRIVIPSTVMTIGRLAFYANKATELVIEDGLESLAGTRDEYTWWMPFHGNCIEKLYLGRNVSNSLLRNSLFMSLRELIIGDMVTELSWKALRPDADTKLKMLAKLTVGSGLASLPFLNEGDNMVEIRVCSHTPLPAEGFNSCTFRFATLYVPLSSKAKYQQAAVWQDFPKISCPRMKPGVVDGMYGLDGWKNKVCDVGGLAAPAAGKGLLIRNGKKYISR